MKSVALVGRISYFSRSTLIEMQNMLHRDVARSLMFTLRTHDRCDQDAQLLTLIIIHALQCVLLIVLSISRERLLQAPTAFPTHRWQSHAGDTRAIRHAPWPHLRRIRRVRTGRRPRHASWRRFQWCAGIRVRLVSSTLAMRRLLH